MNATVTVEIPSEELCLYGTPDRFGKPCLLAKYTKKWNAYSCALYNCILKGNQHPRKCRQCAQRCAEREA